MKLKLPARRLGPDEEDFATAFAFSDDGKRLAVGYWSGAAEVWSTRRLALVKRLPADPGDAADQIVSLAFSADGRVLVGGSRDSGVFMWNVAAGKFVRSFARKSLAGHAHVACVAVSRDGKLVAGGQAQHAWSSGDIGPEQSIEVWDAASGKLRLTLRGHRAGVRALTFSPDDRWLVSASYDGTIRYWDRDTGKEVARFAAAPDRRWAVVTPGGFFADSGKGDDLVDVTRGLKAYPVTRFRDAIARPELIDALLKGDPQGRYARAAESLDLAKLWDRVTSAAGGAKPAH
ncbi:MAG: hypothetical protein P8Y71_25370 [Pseudolabrys sp.]